MSNLTILGDTSGSVVLQAPAIAGSTTLTLPAQTGTVLTSAGLMVDQWNLTTGYTLGGGTPATLTSNLARSAVAGFKVFGAGMSQSSGIFTFPSTGYYRVDYAVIFYISPGGSANRYVQGMIDVTTDGTNYSDAVYATSNLYGVINSGGTYTQVYATTMVNVTNTSLVKVSFVVNANTGCTVAGGSGNQTYMVFTRIGDAQ